MLQTIVTVLEVGILLGGNNNNKVTKKSNVKHSHNRQYKNNKLEK